MDISKYMPNFIKRIPTHMDFEGQKRAERYFQIIIIMFAAVGFVWGYVCQQFSQTMYILIAGFTVSCLLTLPPWPMYRKKPLNWQKARAETEDVASSPSTSSPPSSAQKLKKKK